GGREYAIVVAGAAFAPAAVRVLNRPQPLAGAQDVDFPVILAGCAQPAQREAGSVNVGDAPAAVPASVLFLCPHQVVDASLHGRVAAIEAMRAERLQHASADIGAAGIEHRVVIGEGDFAQKLPVII